MSAAPPAQAASPNGTSGAGSPGPSSSLWKEYKNSEGRPYWFHSVEKRSVWEKPDELKTAREKAFSSTRWREYKSGERSYYVHLDTKETTWKLPTEVQNVIDEQSGDPSPAPPREPSAAVSPAPGLASSSVRTAEASASPASPAPQAPGPAPGPPPIAPPQLANLGESGAPRPIYAGPPPGFAPPGQAPGAPPPRPFQPGGTPGYGPGQMPTGGPVTDAAAAIFSSPQEAFKSLLRSKGVTSAWTWEQTMRIIVTEPLYKALRTLAERKAAFNDFQADLRKEQEEERSRKKAQVKPAVLSVLKEAAAQGQLKMYSSWKTVTKKYGGHQDIKGAVEAIGDESARTIWEEVQKDLKEANDLETRELRHRNMDLMMSLLRTFEADVTTRWRDAHRTVLESAEWKSDAHLSTLELSDMLIVFEEYIRDIEREETEKRKRDDKTQAREERKRRQEFSRLMEEGRAEGWIHAKASWPTVLEKIEKDQRFTSMLGHRGSTPLDLFYDAVDLCDRALETRTSLVEKLIKMADPSWNGLKESESWEDFLGYLQAGLKAAASEPSADMTQWNAVCQEDAELRLVFNEYHEIAAQATRETRKRHERHVRHLIDDARYGLKKSLDDDMIRRAEEGAPFEGVSEVIESLSIREWKRLDEDISDEAERKQVKQLTWEKFSRRQKEKAEERRSTAAAESRRRPPSEAGSDRGARNGSVEAGTRKRKSGVSEYVYDRERERERGGERDKDRDRDRERARRREDREDRRRGGGSGADRGSVDYDYDDRDRYKSSSSSRRRTDRYGHSSSAGGEDSLGALPLAEYEEDPLKRRRTARDPDAPHPSTMISMMSVDTGGTGAAGDDDDKEEGEV